MRICTVCGESRDLTNFGFRNEASGKRHSRCKSCMALYGKQHYLANKPSYVARNVQNMRVRRQVLKEKVWAYLVEHACVDCGESDPIVLEFDHIDPELKRADIYSLIRGGWSWKSIVSEMELCQMRCANCHRRRTATQFCWPKLTFPASNSSDVSTTVTPAALRTPRRAGPRAHSIRSRQISRSLSDAGQRICGWCGGVKPVDRFSFRDEKAGTRQSVCRECFSAYRRDHYRLNRVEYIQRNARILSVRGREWRTRVWEFLITHPCVDCGESDFIVLEFDHQDRATKRETVSFLARRGYPWQTVMRELQKCNVRCANCHRRRTALQFRWPKLVIGHLRNGCASDR